MTVPEGKTLHIGNRVFKSGDEIPKHLEAKLKKTQIRNSPVRSESQTKPGYKLGKK